MGGLEFFCTTIESPDGATRVPHATPAPSRPCLTVLAAPVSIQYICSHHRVEATPTPQFPPPHAHVAGILPHPSPPHYDIPPLPPPQATSTRTIPLLPKYDTLLTHPHYDTPLRPLVAGDIELLQMAMTAMNAPADPDNSEERKGCSGRVGKMIFSAGVHQLAMVAYVPDVTAEKVGAGHKTLKGRGGGKEGWQAEAGGFFLGGGGVRERRSFRRSPPARSVPDVFAEKVRTRDGSRNGGAGGRTVWRRWVWGGVLNAGTGVPALA